MNRIMVYLKAAESRMERRKRRVKERLTPIIERANQGYAILTLFVSHEGKPLVEIFPEGYFEGLDLKDPAVDIAQRLRKFSAHCLDAATNLEGGAV